MISNSSVGSYKHTQPGTLIVTVMLGMTALFASLWYFTGKPFWVSMPVLLGCAWLFSSLTIEMSDRELHWHFGPGLIHKSVSLAEIVAAKPVRTGPSWGIHWSPGRGWLYNVSGFDAVAITLRSGKCFALGTDEPQALTERLVEVIRQNAPPGFKA